MRWPTYLIGGCVVLAIGAIGWLAYVFIANRLSDWIMGTKWSYYNNNSESREELQQ